MLTTGGTIVDSAAPADTAPAKSPSHLASALTPTLASIADHWGRSAGAELTVREVDSVDSSDIVPEHWTHLARAIKDEYDDYDGFVVTHGTNTMAYTCAALSFALPNLGKPVVVTGSQLSLHAFGSDALRNLQNALRVALYPYEGGIRGVVCVFGSRIITGTRVKKLTEFELDAFQSSSRARLGSIARIVQVNRPNLDHHHAYLSRGGQSEATVAGALLVESAFAPNLLSITEFPGLRADVMITMCRALLRVEEPWLRGVIFRAFGSGDASTHLIPAFEYLRDEQIPVVVSTQMPGGTSNMRVNPPGRRLAELNLAIPAHDMSVEATTTKLMWLLGQGSSYPEVSRRMLDDLHGEVSVLAEPEGVAV